MSSTTNFVGYLIEFYRRRDFRIEDLRDVSCNETIDLTFDLGILLDDEVDLFDANPNLADKLLILPVGTYTLAHRLPIDQIEVPVMGSQHYSNGAFFEVTFTSSTDSSFDNRTIHLAPMLLPRVRNLSIDVCGNMARETREYLIGRAKEIEYYEFCAVLMTQFG